MRGDPAGRPIDRRLASARSALALIAFLRGLLLAAIAFLAPLGVGLLLDAWPGLPLAARSALLPVATAAAALVLGLHVLGPVRRALRASDEGVALWFEQRIPALRYALVTSADPRFAAAAELADAVTPVDLEQELRGAGRTRLARPLVVVALLVPAVALLPRPAIARVVAPAAGDALSRPGAEAAGRRDPLATIVARVVPPAYAGIAPTTIDEPSTIVALAGSRVTLEGRGGGVRAILGDTIDAIQGPAGWSVALPLPARATAVRLVAIAAPGERPTGARRERVLVLEPITDSVPLVELEFPSRDSVLRAARGVTRLRAKLRDDHGLATAAFEYIVSSGAGETFTFRSGRIAPASFGPGARSATIESQLALDTLGLAPGDLIHLRAVARDRNDVTGPGIGVSETRTLRIARADEYDSVSVDPMPPTEPEKNALSQRMILMMTEELQGRRRRIGASELQRESRRIAVEQTRLRKRVGEVVFVRLSEDGGEHAHFAGDGHEHGQEGPVNAENILAAAERAANSAATILDNEGDESPIVAINRPLLEAYNHMWRATTELELAEPGAAIPWMKRAIEALQRARAAERIYLRGRPPRVVVDLAKVRGSGKERGATSTRSRREALDAARAGRLARFEAALGVIARDAGEAADSLLLLRLDVPANESATARALDRAADALRRGGDATAALTLAHRALSGRAVTQDALTAWGQ